MPEPESFANDRRILNVEFILFSGVFVSFIHWFVLSFDYSPERIRSPWIYYVMIDQCEWIQLVEGSLEPCGILSFEHSNGESNSDKYISHSCDSCTAKNFDVLLPSHATTSLVWSAAVLSLFQSHADEFDREHFSGRISEKYIWISLIRNPSYLLTHFDAIVKRSQSNIPIFFIGLFFFLCYFGSGQQQTIRII